MSYDPDDFDNNPFSEPGAPESAYSNIYENTNPVDNYAAEDPLKSGFGTAEPASETSDQVATESGPELPPKDHEEDSETQVKPEFKPDLSLLPERRSRKNYKITIKVSGIERVAKRDPIVKFDAYTNLPNFRGTVFRSIRRSHNELEKFFNYLNGANAECFIPALPPTSTSYGAGSEEDEIKLTSLLQEWFDKITSNPILIRNEEFVYFIENDSGYSPINKGKVPATGLKRKTLKQLQPPPDEVEELVHFRPYIKSIYVEMQNVLKSFEKMERVKKNYGLHVTELGHKVAELASLETMHPGMVNLWKKLGKSLVSYGDIEAIKAVYELATFGDQMKLLSDDSYVIKEQLTNRHLLMRDLQNAEQITKSKHAQALKIKTKRYEDPLKIDQIIKELEECKTIEDNMRLKVKRVSDNMLIEKQQILEYQDKKIRKILKEYTEKVIENERKTLTNFEKIRIDVRLVDENGGLSRLGRENYPKLTSNLRVSQRYDGDDWSGDRKKGPLSPEEDTQPVHKSPTQQKTKEAVLDYEDDEVMDPKYAASLLGVSTF